jgi:hypothetical protein
MSNFYRSTKEAFDLLPLEVVTEVIEGLAWLTLKRPSSSSRGELDLPDRALVAVCQPVQTSPSMGLPFLNKAGPPVRKVDFCIFFLRFPDFQGTVSRELIQIFWHGKLKVLLGLLEG